MPKTRGKPYHSAADLREDAAKLARNFRESIKKSRMGGEVVILATPTTQTVPPKPFPNVWQLEAVVVWSEKELRQEDDEPAAAGTGAGSDGAGT